MRAIKIAALVAILVALCAGIWWVRQEVAIDSCLDAGGRWNAPTAACIGARPEG